MRRGRRGCGVGGAIKRRTSPEEYKQRLFVTNDGWCGSGLQDCAKDVVGRASRWNGTDSACTCKLVVAIPSVVVMTMAIRFMVWLQFRRGRRRQLRECMEEEDSPVMFGMNLVAEFMCMFVFEYNERCFGRERCYGTRTGLVLSISILLVCCEILLLVDVNRNHRNVQIVDQEGMRFDEEG